MVSRVPVSLVASEKMLFLFCIKPNSFLTFSLPSPSSDPKVRGGGLPYETDGDVRRKFGI